MVTLRHPRWPDVTQEVDAECVPGWVASGWLDERPKYNKGGFLPPAVRTVTVPDKCCGSGVCLTCPEVKVATAPKPGPKRRTKNPSIGDD